MPLDNFFDWKTRIGWERKFLFLPRRCIVSKKWMWLRTAYRGTVIVTGPGDPVMIYRWIQPNEFLLLRLRGAI